MPLVSGRFREVVVPVGRAVERRNASRAMPEAAAHGDVWVELLAGVWGMFALIGVACVINMVYEGVAILTK